MKKIVTILLLCITITSFAQKKTYKIGVLFDKYNDKSFNYIYQTLRQEIKAVVGEDANIVLSKNNILQNNYNVKIAKDNYHKLLQSADIILTFGVLNSEILKQQKSFPKPVIVIGDLRDSINQKLTQSTTSGINNLLYLTYSETILQRLNTFRKLADFKTVGIVVEKNIADISKFKDFVKRKFQNADFQYKIITFDNVEDIINKLDDIDALELENSFSLTQKDIQKLSGILIEKKIPSFSAVSRFDVKNGIMATNISDNDIGRFFRRIALSVEEYVNGTNFSELPVLIDFRKALVINRETALALNIPLNYSMLGNVEFINNPEFNPKANKIYDLPQLISEVLNENLTLKSESKEIEISNQNIKSARSNYFPEVKANAQGIYLDPKMAELSQGSNAEWTTGGNITLQQIVFSPEANANIKIQKSLAKAQQEKFNTEQLDAIFNSANTYFNVLILKANVKIQANNLALTKRNLEIAEENYKAGQTGKMDLLRLRSQKAQNTQTLVEAINQLQKSYGYINQLTNKQPDYKIDIKEAGLNDDIFKDYNYDAFMNLINTPSLREKLIDFLVQEAYANAPEIKQLSHHLKAIDYKKNLYGTGRFLPQVALQGQYNHQFSKSGKGSVYPQGYPIPPKGNYNVALSVSVPIFNRNTNHINKQTAQIQKEQLEINKSNFRAGLALNIHNSILDLINEVSNIELSKVSEQSAKEALDLTQNAYSSGAVTIVQLIDVQNNYIATQQARANATYNYLIKMLQLERYLGNYFLLNTKEESAEFNRRFLEFVGEK